MTQADLRRHLDLFSHDTFFYDDLSGFENLQIVARLLGYRSRCQESLERVGLGAYQHRPVRTYSAGMKRRLCLARILVKDSLLVLMDEPFTQLDVEGSRLMEEVILGLYQQGRGVILSSHDLTRAQGLSHRHFELTSHNDSYSDVSPSVIQRA